jgi:hypothetical protein
MIAKSSRGEVDWLILIFIAMTISRSATSFADPPVAAKTLRMSTALQFDPVLNQNAYSVLVPENWKFQGEIVWPNGTPSPWPHLSVSDPVQHAAWRRFPRMFYAGGLNNPRYPEGSTLPNGSEVRDIPASPREYVTTLLIPKMIAEVNDAKDVHLLSETDLPDVAQAIAANDPLHRTVHTERFRIAYTAPDGPVEREFIATLIVGQPPRGNLGGTFWAADVTTMRAPAGRLDTLMPTFATINSSVTMLLPWFNTLTQVQQKFLNNQEAMEAKMLADQAQAINQRMAIMRQYAQESSQMVSDEIHQRFAEQMHAKNEQQIREMHYINNTGGYTNPNDGSTVTLSAEYQYHYVDNHGNVVETNDPTYSPPVDPSTSWQQMQQVN